MSLSKYRKKRSSSTVDTMRHEAEQMLNRMKRRGRATQSQARSYMEKAMRGGMSKAEAQNKLEQYHISVGSTRKEQLRQQDHKSAPSQFDANVAVA